MMPRLVKKRGFGLQREPPMRARLPYPMREPKFTPAWPPSRGPVRLYLALAGVVALIAAQPVQAAGPSRQQETGSPMNAPSDRPEPTGRTPDDMIKEGEICLDNGDASRARDLFETALPQSDNLVLDHPESVEARALLKQISDDLAPRLEIEPVVQTDDGGNRVDKVTAAGSFMAEPQTEVRIALTGVRTRSDCGDAI